MRGYDDWKLMSEEDLHEENEARIEREYEAEMDADRRYDEMRDREWERYDLDICDD